MRPLISKWIFSAPFRVSGVAAGVASLHIPSDIIFAALWRTAHSIGKDMFLLAAVIDERLLISDALPFLGDEALFVPQLFAQKSYCRAGGAEAMPSLRQESRWRGNEEVTVTITPEKSGLYVLVRTTEEVKPLLDTLFELLGTNGIGAGRSVGWGQFKATPLRPLESLFGDDAQALAAGIYDECGVQMSLSACQALDPSVLQEGASYALLPRLWHLADGQKEPFVLLAAGSTFERRFDGRLLHREGSIDEASSWRLAKPFFVGVSSWNA